MTTGYTQKKCKDLNFNLDFNSLRVNSFITNNIIPIL